MNFNGANVLITGASAGIGAEFARQFHALGSQLVLVARRKDKLQLLVEHFNSSRPSSARALAADLSTPGSAIQPSGSLLEVEQFIRSNSLDILINNAGFGSFGEFDELQCQREIEMVMLNVVAPLRLAHAALPQMKGRRSGAIVTVSSVAAFQPIPYMATYSATKSFNFCHSMALRYELGSYGVRCLAVCPGPTATEFGGVARVPGSITGIHRDDVSAVVRESIKALQNNQAFVVPCLRSRVMSLFSRLLPFALTTYFTARLLRPVYHGITK